MTMRVRFRWPPSLKYSLPNAPEPEPLVRIPTLSEFRGSGPPRKLPKKRKPKPKRQPRG